MMKRFICKILFFLLLFIVIVNTVTMLLPYYWGNPWYSSKIKYLESENSNLPNTFFFGSSRIYRQIDSKLFDKIYFETTNDKIISFNLGAPATFCPQTYYLYENFLESKIAKSTKLVFIELMPVDLFSKELMHQERTTYWQNLTDYMFVFKSLWNNQNLDYKSKLSSVKNYSIAYSENVFGIGHFGEQLVNKNYYKIEYNGPNMDGFYSLEENLLKTTDASVRSSLTSRRNSLINDSVLLQKRMLESIKSHEKITKNFDEINLSRILHLIDLSKENGIDLIFILPPRDVNKQIVNLARQIPDKNIIDLSNAEIFPKLYSYKNLFDVGHLNDNGTKIFTDLLVQQYLINNDFLKLNN